MNDQLLGADTLVPVSQDVSGTSVIDLVRKRFGAMPLFWGRYFKRPDSTDEYQPSVENPILAANNVKLLPIARQTNRVAGSASDGAQDAALNADAFIKALGLDYLAPVGGEMLMFLDVEGTSAQNPNLGMDYWLGWSTALVARSESVSGGRFRIVPGVYCRQNQAPT